MRLIREPLLHFLLLGAVLFGLNGAFDVEAEQDPVVIEVTRGELLSFMQQRAKVFNDAYFNELLDGMSAAERRQLVDAYVRDEVLYREARAMQFGEKDYVVRRRLIQQLEVLVQDVTVGDEAIGDAEIKAHFDANRRDYFIEPSITFTHVFFSRAKHGDVAEAVASRELERLNAVPVAFHEAVAHGDRFPYNTNYVDKGADHVAAHFGPAVQSRLFELSADTTTWRGPLCSPLGCHLVLIAKQAGGYLPALDDIRDRVAIDARRARREQALERAVAALVDRYEVKDADGLISEPRT